MTIRDVTLQSLNVADVNSSLDYLAQRQISDWPGLLSDASLSFTVRSANLVWAGPASGAPATPAWRALVAADIPNLDASKITTGLLALARGGTAVDLSASGSATAVLAQDASHVISARSLIAADIPSLDATKITTGLLALARGGTHVDLSTTGSATAVLAQDASHVISARSLIAADIPNLDAGKITTGQLALAQGGTHADLSGTGGTSQVLKQTSVGGNVSVAQLASSDLSDVANLVTTNTAQALTSAGVKTFGGVTHFQDTTDVTKSVNGALQAYVFNTNNGAAAYAQVAAINDLIAALGVQALSSTFPGTRYGVNLANLAEISAFAGFANFVLGTQGAIPLIFGTNNTEAARFDSGQLLTLKKTITSYNSITTAGQGVPPVVGVLSLTGQTAALGLTNVAASVPAGLYTLVFHLVITTAGTGGTIQVDVKTTDRFGAFLDNGVGGTAATLLNGRTRFAYPVQAAASSNIQVQTTFTGVTGTPAYAIDAAVIRMV